MQFQYLYWNSNSCDIIASLWYFNAKTSSD